MSNIFIEIFFVSFFRSIRVREKQKQTLLRSWSVLAWINFTSHTILNLIEADIYLKISWNKKQNTKIEWNEMKLDTEQFRKIIASFGIFRGPLKVTYYEWVMSSKGVVVNAIKLSLIQRLTEWLISHSSLESLDDFIYHLSSHLIISIKIQFLKNIYLRDCLGFISHFSSIFHLKNLFLFNFVVFFFIIFFFCS